MRFEKLFISYRRQVILTSIRVLLCVGNQVLGVGIKQLLSTQDDMQVLALNLFNARELLHSIEYFQPDVVIIDNHLHTKALNKLPHRMEENKQLFVIQVSPNDNSLHIFQRKEVLLEQASDFVSLIRNH
jgi:chemotaxis response regulator CheB